MVVRTRFAPSPTGYLHLGNARTALFNWLYTRHEKGTFVLRLEDTDQARSTEEYANGIARELRWLGLEWDEGVDRGGPFGPYRQSERRGDYRQAFERLLDQGSAYYCFCTPEERERDREADRAAGRMPRYPGRCRSIPRDRAEERLQGGEKGSGRFRVPEGRIGFEDRIRGWVEVDSVVIGDPILVRSDGWPTYNFAVVVDDIRMRITDVIRGEDHLSNTPRQILLYRALGAEPPRFAHLPLVLGSDHAPLSKRHGDTSLRQFFDRGYLPEAVFNYLALLGWSPAAGGEVLSREELVREFDLSRVGKAPGVFDRTKLDWLGNQHLRRADSSRLASLALPFLQERGWLPAEIPPAERRWVERLVDLLKEGLSSLGELPETDAAGILFDFDPLSLEKDPVLREEIRDPGCRRVILALAESLATEEALSGETLRQKASEVGRKTGTKGKDLYHPIRLALTGKGSGPELARLVPLIEEAAALSLPRPVPGCAERARAVAGMISGEAGE